MSEEIMYIAGDDISPSYIESLIKARVALGPGGLRDKLDQVISAELDLALLAAQKAKSEIMKKNKNNVTPINGGDDVA